MGNNTTLQKKQKTIKTAKNIYENDRKRRETTNENAETKYDKHENGTNKTAWETTHFLF